MADDLAAKSRAELLDLCKEQGWKATGWKKDKMLEELAKLEEPQEAPVEPGDLDSAEELVEPQGEPDEPEEAPVVRADPDNRRSGWCMPHWPLWVVSHQRCRAHEAYGRVVKCGCACHEPGWEPPEVPVDSRPSKFEEGEYKTLQQPNLFAGATEWPAEADAEAVTEALTGVVQAVVQEEPARTEEQEKVLTTWVEYLQGTRAQGFHQTPAQRDELYGSVADFPDWLKLELEHKIEGGLL